MPKQTKRSQGMNTPKKGGSSTQKTSLKTTSAPVAKSKVASSNQRMFRIDRCVRLEDSAAGDTPTKVGKSLFVNLFRTVLSYVNVAVDGTRTRRTIAGATLVPDSWIVQLFLLFARFRLCRLVLEWVPEVGTIKDGSITMGVLDDPNDLASVKPFSADNSVVEYRSYTAAEIEGRAIRYKTFPVWATGQRIDLLAAKSEGFVDKLLSLGTLFQLGGSDAELDGSDILRRLMPFGLPVVATEGVDTSVSWKDLGHFRLHLVCDLWGPNPVPETVESTTPADPARGASVAALLNDPVGSTHNLLFYRCDEGYRACHAVPHSSFSPFGKCKIEGRTVSLPIDLNRAGLRELAILESLALVTEGLEVERLRNGTILREVPGRPAKISFLIPEESSLFGITGLGLS